MKGGSFNPTSPFCFNHTLTTTHYIFQLSILVCHIIQHETCIRTTRMITDLHSPHLGLLWHANYTQCQNATPTHVQTHTHKQVVMRNMIHAGSKGMCTAGWINVNVHWFHVGQEVFTQTHTRTHARTHAHTHTQNPLRCSEQNTSVIHSWYWYDYL